MNSRERMSESVRRVRGVALVQDGIEIMTEDD